MTLTDGDSATMWIPRVMAFETCGAQRPCAKASKRRRTSSLLEPMMRVEVVTPEDYMGDIIGDLNGRRGSQVKGMDSAAEMPGSLRAMVPLANMFGYVNNLAFHEPGPGPVQHAFRSL